MRKDICSYKGISCNEETQLNERPAFLRDFGSIIYKSQFRRLSNKTQVFLNPLYDFPRTRLTHSIEVEQISREISRYFANKLIENKINFDHQDDQNCFKNDFEDLVAAAALTHDIGQAPFGHRGEKTLHDLMSNINKDQIVEQNYFEANKQNVRLLLGNKSRKPYGVTCALVDAVMKYKSNVFKGKNKYPGNYTYEEKIVGKIHNLTSKGYRNPACYIMEASDDIAYISSDFQDALKLKLIDFDEALEILKDINIAETCTDVEKRNWSDYLQASLESDNFEKITSVLIKSMLYTIKQTIDYFIETLCRDENINNLPLRMHNYFKSGNCELNPLYFGAGNVFNNTKKSIYAKNLLNNKEIARNELLAKKIITDLWGIMQEQLICDNYKSTDFFKLIPDHVKNNIELAHSDQEVFQEQKYQCIADYISGMTDRYAIYLWEQLFNPSSLKFI